MSAPNDWASPPETDSEGSSEEIDKNAILGQQAVPTGSIESQQHSIKDPFHNPEHVGHDLAPMVIPINTSQGQNEWLTEDLINAVNRANLLRQEPQPPVLLPNALFGIWYDGMEVMRLKDEASTVRINRHDLDVIMDLHAWMKAEITRINALNSQLEATVKAQNEQVSNLQAQVNDLKKVNGELKKVNRTPIRVAEPDIVDWQAKYETEKAAKEEAIRSLYASDDGTKATSWHLSIRQYIVTFEAAIIDRYKAAFTHENPHPSNLAELLARLKLADDASPEVSAHVSERRNWALKLGMTTDTLNFLLNIKRTANSLAHPHSAAGLQVDLKPEVVRQNITQGSPKTADAVLLENFATSFIIIFQCSNDPNIVRFVWC